MPALIISPDKRKDVPYLYRATAQTRFPLRRQRSVTKKQRSMRVLARVLNEFPPVFSTAFECSWWPSVPMLSMGYDQKHFCHGRGLLGIRPLSGVIAAALPHQALVHCALQLL